MENVSLMKMKCIGIFEIQSELDASTKVQTPVTPYTISKLKLIEGSNPNMTTAGNIWDIKMHLEYGKVYEWYMRGPIEEVDLTGTRMFKEGD